MWFDLKKELQDMLDRMSKDRVIVQKSADRMSRSHLMISCSGGRTDLIAVSRISGLRKRVRINSDKNRVYRLANAAYSRELARRMRHNQEILKGAIGKLLPMDYLSILPALPKYFELLDPERVIYPGYYERDADYPVPSRTVRPVPLTLNIGNTDPWEWARKPYCENTVHPESKVHRARQGALCRSKSEASIFDIFMDLKIPFHYDEVFTVSGRRISPDFAGVRRDGAVILGEHRGMHSPEYRKQNEWKEHLYAEAGFYPGVNLLYTYDSVSGALNKKLIEAQIRDIFWL